MGGITGYILRSDVHTYKKTTIDRTNMLWCKLFVNIYKALDSELIWMYTIVHVFLLSQTTVFGQCVTAKQIRKYGANIICYHCVLYATNQTDLFNCESKWKYANFTVYGNMNVKCKATEKPSMKSNISNDIFTIWTWITWSFYSHLDETSLLNYNLMTIILGQYLHIGREEQ